MFARSQVSTRVYAKTQSVRNWNISTSNKKQSSTLSPVPFSLKNLPLCAPMRGHSGSAGGRLSPASVHNVLYLLPSPSKITSIPHTSLFSLERLNKLPGLPSDLVSSARTKLGLTRPWQQQQQQTL